ncbi:FKBP-type peptidyl-prolyl cis-trans isomerase FkpA [Glaciecola punicea ACAM 611]|jgi:FKBP-type peptidyl-prolyl cis-trans isomerase FkpA|uniref:Peptidyl-prolyl cis-trans isomerase n=1 Tax=Glaciecola punicea ACAM 611 TaxID=1121923 RepID=H5TAQ8_9ALTE|nr:FKBP-type peptidyl-prolyl cis-trans isomerase [Glaciecola punicea]OFA31850.1 peptidylprolyl isomerase [Glaciecola punicea]GAB55385.1 FKBP-type peptidyl-prolyl cis-trans isomerase FkpA [Glaciecola punicea ACAM 611]
MKKAPLTLIIATTLALSACSNDNAAQQEANDTLTTYTTEVGQESYALGARMGIYAQEQVAVQDELGLQSDKAALLAGFTDGFNGNSQYSDEEIDAYVQAFAMKFQAAEQTEQAALIEAGKNYLVENAKREEVVTTDSGLQYEVLTEAEGANPKAGDTVRVHYHGTLVDGTVFDSSVNRGEPAEFPLNRVIPGWTEGVQLMEVGSKYRFYIPSELAYGQRATGAIPANSTLIFDVELLAIAPFTD